MIQKSTIVLINGSRMALPAAARRLPVALVGCEAGTEYQVAARPRTQGVLAFLGELQR
jgi:ribose 1,5-bisphosphokinase PhnN